MKRKFDFILLGSSAAFALALGTTGCARHAAKAPPQAAAPPPVVATAPEPVRPAPEAPAPPPPVSKPEFQSAYFDYDSYDLGGSARDALDRTAKVMRDRTELVINIEGHCDERGTVEYNLALGERRANAARDYLTAAGVPRNRIRVVSYGKERPLVEGHQEAAWAMNRCAHVVPRATAPGEAMNAGDSK